MDSQSKFQYGFTWTLFESYKIESGLIIPTGKKLKEYNPGEYSNIPTELARIANMTQGKPNSGNQKTWNKNLISFYVRYGLLGYTVETKRLKKLDGCLYDGDPLIWALDQAASVDTCLKLSKYINDSDELELKKILKFLQARQSAAQYLGIPTLTGYKKSFYDFSKMNKEPIKMAQTIRRELINNNLGFVSRQITEDKPGYENSILKHNSLIQYVYWVLADTFMNEKLCKCQECGTVFFAHRGEQKYCPGIGNKESRCSRKSRMRKLRENNKRESEDD